MKLRDCKEKILIAATKTSEAVVSSAKTTTTFVSGVASATVNTLITLLRNILTLMWQIITLPIDIIQGFVILAMLMRMAAKSKKYEQQVIPCVLV